MNRTAAFKIILNFTNCTNFDSTMFCFRKMGTKFGFIITHNEMNATFIICINRYSRLFYYNRNVLFIFCKVKNREVNNEKKIEGT